MANPITTAKINVTDKMLSAALLFDSVKTVKQKTSLTWEDIKKGYTSPADVYGTKGTSFFYFYEGGLYEWRQGGHLSKVLKVTAKYSALTRVWEA